jgi:hypothetical protein
MRGIRATSGMSARARDQRQIRTFGLRLGAAFRITTCVALGGSMLTG